MLLSNVFPYAIVSENGINSLSYSLSVFRDSEEYYSLNNLVDPNDDILERYNAYLSKVDFSLLLKGAYEISFTYAYNESEIVDEIDKSLSLNGFALPSDKEHVFLKFNYHFKERSKFPLNLFFGLEYGRNITYSDSYESLSYNVGFYKEFDSGNYPIIPYIELATTSCINDQYNNSFTEFKDSYFFTKMGLFINLPVETLNNTASSDIIWINPSFTLNDKDIFIGVNIGLSHPFN